MILYGTIRETPDALNPFLAVISDQDGNVVAISTAGTREQADDRIQELKFMLNKLVVEKRRKRLM